MTSVGSKLRSARESQGRSVAEIAGELCMTQRYVRAIEADDIKVLPGIFFYKAFVKQYAGALGLDFKMFGEQLQSIGVGREVEVLPVRVEPRRVKQPKRPETPRVGDVTKAAAAAVGIQRFVDHETGDPNYRPPVRRLDPIVEEGNKYYFSDRKIGMSVAALAAVLLVCSGFYAWWNRPRPVASAGVTAANSLQPVSAVSGDSMPKVDVTQQSDGIHVALNLSATEPTWVSVTSGGKEVFSGILEPSQSKTLVGLDGAKMKVGNAGGVEVRWNGKSIGPIGARGQVRTVMFTPQNFEILQPAPTTKPEDAPVEAPQRL
jgi:cytoskeleton protein RodZ